MTDRARTILWVGVAAAAISETVAVASRSGFALGLIEVAAFLAIMPPSAWLRRDRNLCEFGKSVLKKRPEPFKSARDR